MFTFRKHVSHLVWQLHVCAYCVVIVCIISHSFWRVNTIQFQQSLLHFQYIKTYPYPLVELTGAASVTSNSNYWHIHSHLSSYLDTVESGIRKKHVTVKQRKLESWLLQ